MERFCGILKNAIGSRVYPWASLDKYCLNKAYLRQLGLRYSVAEELADAIPNFRRLPADLLSSRERDFPECERLETLEEW
jgi:hypothetical protein